MTTERLDLHQVGLFGGRFGRCGEVLKLADIPVRPEEYRIVSLDRKGLLPADQLVRKVEGNFAQVYDEVQFTTPGMRHVAEVDTAVLERWIGDASGKRVLEIGPGANGTSHSNRGHVEIGEVYRATSCLRSDRRISEMIQWYVWG